jgi:cephalosporin hydroxylase
MDRILYQPPIKPSLRQRMIEDAPAAEMPDVSLFARADVDPMRLAANVRHALRERAQVTLAEVVSLHPIRHGLAELAAYLELATHGLHCAIDEARTELIHWTDSSGNSRQASLPLLIYTL